MLAGFEVEAGYFSSYMRTGRVIHQYQRALAKNTLLANEQKPKD
jgi:hypothetical protein